MLSYPALSHVALQTPRLILREFAAADAEAIQVYAGDPEVTRFTSFGPNTPELTNVVLAHWIQEQTRSPRTEWPLAVVRREDGTLIGGTGFGVPDWSTGAAIFGYVLRRSAWGQGYATEAGQVVADWALGEVGVRRLVAHCEPANLASVSVLSKIGFAQKEGLVSMPRTDGEVRRYWTFVKERQ
ncbi:MAG: GNAT family N-acetyltransferase [Janthinobacterium lividum]